MKEPKVKKTVLGNGIRLLTSLMPQVKSVAVLVLVEVGSRYENEKTNGLAHFYEHLVFRGTKKYPSQKELALAVETIGAKYNAETAKDYMAYWVKAEASHLETVLKVLSQMVGAALLKPRAIVQEKPIILEEINMREDTPETKVYDSLVETVFINHPLGLPGAGEKKAIKRFARKDFLEFQAKYYTGKNIVITLAGNSQISDKIQDLVSRYFGRLPEGKQGKFKTFSRLPRSPQFPRLKLIEKPTDQTHLALGFTGFGRQARKNRYAQAMLNMILGVGFSSRLFQKVREEKSLAYYIQSEVDIFKETALLAVAAGVDKKKTGEALNTILDEIRALRKFAPQSAELRRAKDFLRGNWVLSLEDSLYQAYWYGLDELFENRLRPPEEIFELVEEVTLDDIIRVARQIFTPQNLSLAVVGDGLKEENLKEILFSNFSNWSH